MLKAVPRQFRAHNCQVSDALYMVDTVDVGRYLVIQLMLGALRHKRSANPDLRHSDIPARILTLFQIEQGEGYLPVVDAGWIREERKDLQFDGVEIVDGN